MYGYYDLNIIEANETLSVLVVDIVYQFKRYLLHHLNVFYNQSCLDILLSGYGTSINISIPNISVPSRFLRTTKIESLIDELFLQEIVNKTFFDK
jgi:hypothetical protein